MVDSGVYRLLMLSTGYFAVTLVLVALRTADIVSWDWIWVLCPLWAPFALTCIAFGSLILLWLVRADTGRTIIPSLLGGLLLVSGTAFPLQAADVSSANIDAFDRQRARLSALDAISQAELFTMGDVLDVRFEVRDGRPDFLVHADKDGQLMTVLIDAMGLADPVSLDAKPEPALADERAAAAALPHSNLRFDDAIGAAERRLHGTTIEARLALRDGKPTVEVDIVRDAVLHTATIDPIANIEGTVAESR